MRTLSPLEMYGSCKPKGEDLVMAHLGLVKRVALHLKARIPAFMELDELIQVGMIGLLEASRAFDPVKGIEFENFAHSRVRGAMLDEVRRLSFLPRSAVANSVHPLVSVSPSQSPRALSGRSDPSEAGTEVSQVMT